MVSFSRTRTQSRTFKFEAPGVVESPMYFTIVGNPPTSFFFNTKDMEDFQWITALMTSYSKQLKAGVSIYNIINDMKKTFDAKGGYYAPDKSCMVKSIVHHIGLILEKFANTEMK